MSSNFSPKEILKTKDKDGNTITTEVYTLEAYSNGRILVYIGIAVGACLAAPIASSILLIFYCIDRNVDPQPLPFNLCGFLISLYFLFDFYHGWLVSAIVSAFSSPTEMKDSVYVNAALMIVHFICLAYGNGIYEAVDRSKTKLFAILSVSTVLLFFIAMSVMDQSVSKAIQGQASSTKTSNTEDTNNPETVVSNQSDNTTNNTQNYNTLASPPIDTASSVKSTPDSSVQQQNDSAVSNPNQNVNNDVTGKEDIVRAYIKAQDDRDFNAVYGYYAPVVRRSWGMYNPSLSQICQAVSHLWAITSSSSQTINSIQSLNDSTILADVTNLYTTRKLRFTESKEYNIYFVLDTNNKIVETYGYEK